MPTGRIWIGDGNTIVSDTVYVDEPNNRVGIGIDDPKFKLNLYGDGSSSNGIVSTGSYDFGGFKIGQGYNPSGNTSSNITSKIEFLDTAPIGYYGDDILFSTTPHTFNLSDSDASLERMRITHDGNVGIGNTNPSSQLSSSRVLDISSTGNSEVILDHTDAGATSDLGLYSWNRNNDHLAHIKASCDGATDSAFISFHAQATGGSFSGPGSNERMRIKSNGNVGIGTTSPRSKLHVEGVTGSVPALGAAASAAQIGGSSYGTLFSTLTSGTGVIQQGRSDGVTLTFPLLINPNGGNVGIGTTSLSSISSTSATLSLGSTSATTSGGIAFQVSGGTVKAYNYVASNYLINQTVSGIGQIFYGAGSERMRIHNTTGNVGIGTTSPNAKLEVAGSTRITGTGLDVGYGNNGTNYFQAGYGRTTNGYALLDLIGDATYTDYGFRILRNNTGPNTDTDIIHRGTGDLDLKTVEAGDIGFHTTSIQRMIVKSDGDVGIGTTNPSQKLHVVGRVASTAGNGFQIINSYGSPLLGDFYGSFTTTSPLYVGGPCSGQACYASAFNITSDYRLKENEAPLTEASSRIKKLKPIRFNYISSENTVDGFLAHEVAEVIPEAVTGKKDAVREDGSDELQGLDLSKIVPLLTAALQESITKIEQLEQRIQTLENK